MKIVLIGYRGTGKSVVGEAVARRLGMPYIGMDNAIVAIAGIPIPQIVEKYGWSKFRDLESELARQLSMEDSILVDTGGGVIERAENMEALAKNACVIWLKASVEVIVGRIEKGSHRPSLIEGKSFTEEVAEVLSKRMDKYRSAAHYEIDTDELPVDKIADKIIAIWKNHTQA